jgi:hypothetical protein
LKDQASKLDELVEFIHSKPQLKQPTPSWADIIGSNTQTNALVAAVDKETSERKKRECSIVIKGIEETNAETPEKRKESDRLEVVKLLENLSIEVNVNDLTDNIVRIGKPRVDNETEEKTKPRPIRLTFKSQAKRDAIINESSSLNANEETKKYRIDPDRTRQQQEALSALYEEAKQLQETKPKNGRIWVVTGKINPLIRSVRARQS